jgi:hypothetical protein
MQSSGRVGAAGNDDGIFVTCRAKSLNDVPLHDDIRERRIVGLLAGVELDGRAFIAPDPVRVAVAEVGDDIVGDDRAAVEVLAWAAAPGMRPMAQRLFS